MKNILIIIISVLGFQALFGQDCYDRIANLSGIDHSEYQDEVNTASCELRSILPSNFQSSFKVIEAGMYVHMGVFKGFGYPEGFDYLKTKLTTPYYAFVAKQNDKSGLYTKFWCDVRLPDVTSNGCIPNINAEASGLFELVLESEFDKLDRIPSRFPEALVVALQALTEYVETAIVCCESGGNVAQCIECTNPDNIAAKLLSEGFLAESINNIGDYDTGSGLPPQITDHANLLFTVNDLTAVNIPASYVDQIPIYQAKGLSIKVYITKDENVCTEVWQQVKDEIENNPADVVFWHHIHNGKPGPGDEKLFSRVYLNGQGSHLKKGGEQLQAYQLGPDPFTAIIGALGSALADAMVQTVAIYYLDNDIEEGDWAAAFEKINIGSVVWSGFTGAFIVSSKAITVAIAVGAGMAEVTYNAIKQPNYTIQQAGLDFAIAFVGDIIGNAVGGAAISKLKNVNLSWFSEKGISKLKALFNSSSAARRKLIALCWKLEDQNITTHAARGINFENWLGEWLFKAQGFIQTPHAFKGIDFHRPSDNFAISVKTSIQKTKSGIKGLINKNDHIRTLVRAIDDKIIRSANFPNDDKTISGIKLLLSVPEENVSLVTGFVGEIMEDLKLIGIDTDLISWEVRSMEAILGI